MDLPRIAALIAGLTVTVAATTVAQASCIGPSICRLAVIEPVSCNPLEAYRESLQAALETAYSVEKEAGYIDQLVAPTDTAVIDAQVRRSRVFPCGQPRWLLDGGGRWQQSDERRSFVYTARDRDPCAQLSRSTDLEVVIHETPCFDTFPRGVAQLLDLRGIRIRSGAEADSRHTPVPEIPVRPDFVLGDPSAPVTVTAFTTYRCGADDVSTDPIPALRARYGERLRVAHRTFIHTEPSGGKAPELLVRAALAAARQGRDLEYMARTPTFPYVTLFDEAAAVAMAEELELDIEAFVVDLAKPPGAYVRDAGGGADALDVYVAVHRHYTATHDLPALAAARAAIAAGVQGRFWEMRRWLLAHCQDLSREPWSDAVRELDLDPERFASDLRSTAALQLITEDLELAGSVGIVGGWVGTILVARGNQIPTGWPLDLYPDLIPELR